MAGCEERVMLFQPILFLTTCPPITWGRALPEQGDPRREGQWQPWWLLPSGLIWRQSQLPQRQAGSLALPGALYRLEKRRN